MGKFAEQLLGIFLQFRFAGIEQHIGIELGGAGGGIELQTRIAAGKIRQLRAQARRQAVAGAVGQFALQGGQPFAVGGPLLIDRSELLLRFNQLIFQRPAVRAQILNFRLLGLTLLGQNASL